MYSKFYFHHKQTNHIYKLIELIYGIFRKTPTFLRQGSGRWFSHLRYLWQRFSCQRIRLDTLMPRMPRKKTQNFLCFFPRKIEICARAKKQKETAHLKPNFSQSWEVLQAQAWAIWRARRGSSIKSKRKQYPLSWNWLLLLKNLFYSQKQDKNTSSVGNDHKMQLAKTRRIRRHARRRRHTASAAGGESQHVCVCYAQVAGKLEEFFILDFENNFFCIC